MVFWIYYFGLKSDANSIRILKVLNTERYGQNPSPSFGERLRLNPFGSSLNELILCGNITLIPRPLPPAPPPPLKPSALAIKESYGRNTSARRIRHFRIRRQNILLFCLWLTSTASSGCKRALGMCAPSLFFK